MLLETKETLIRLFKKDDLSDYHEYCSQNNVGEMAGWKSHETLEESYQKLMQNIENNFIYAIVYKKNNKVIGHIAINNDSEKGRDDTKELGFALNRDYHNRGIMSEVIIEILKDLFSKKIQYVYACCFKENLASKHLIEKCGFKLEQEGTFYSKSLHKKFDSYEYVYNNI